MTWDHGVKLVDSLAWPLIAAVLVVILGPAIRKFLGEAKTVSFSGAGFEASANRDDVAAAAALEAAVQHKMNGAERPRELPDIAPLIEKTSSPRRRSKLQQSTVLWVDDRPENNLYERRALEAPGIHIDLANDSQEALRKLSGKEYDLVISDMAGPSSKQAGYELLKLVRDGGNSVPFIIYAGSNLPLNTGWRLKIAGRRAVPMIPMSYSNWRLVSCCGEDRAEDLATASGIKKARRTNARACHVVWLLNFAGFQRWVFNPASAQLNPRT